MALQSQIGRRRFLSLCSGAAAGALLTPMAYGDPNRSKKPNIILFLVDDMGWQDTSQPFWTSPTPFNRHFRTPNMERLARQGIRFTHAYAHAVCSPTRTALMTGQNPVRHHVTNWTLEKDRDTSGGWGRVGPPRDWNRNGLQPDHVTLPKLLQKAGYFTIHCGKAHWGAYDTPGSDPLNLGFDVNIAGHAAGGPGSYSGLTNFGNKEKGAYTRPWGIPGLEKYHGLDINLTDALTIEAREALGRGLDTGKPFYLYMAHYAVHAPIQPHKRFLGDYANRNYAGTDIDIPDVEEQYASMVEGMDASLGALLEDVEARGEAENTLVIFTSDNGGLSAHARGTTPRGTGDNTHNWPLKAGKGSAYEGGTRVPFIAAWAKLDPENAFQRDFPLEADAISTQPIVSEDLFPTLVAIAVAREFIPQDYRMDGRDVSDYLLKRSADAERPLCFHYPHVWGPRGPGYEPHSAIRVGAWKAIYFYNRNRWELYNVVDDIGETQDLAAEQPERLQEMAAKMKRDFIAMDAQWPTDRRTGEDEPMRTPSELQEADSFRAQFRVLPAAILEAIEQHKAAPFVLSDPEWYSWGASVLRTEDGKYHMFYARWPRKFSFTAWLTHSEIAHAVADTPTGPFRYVETVIQGRGPGHWDQFTAHNPKIKRFGDQYYLYYVSTNDPLGDADLIETARVGHSHKNWMPIRNAQRTGVAIADSIDGPWRRLDKPIIEPAGPIATLTVNPAVVQGPDGTFFMIVKGDRPGATKFVRNQALATAPRPEGPWTIQPKAVIDTFDTEDASMWYDSMRKRFYAVFHAHRFIGMMTSKDGYQWEKAQQFELTPKSVSLSDGATWTPDRMERPFVLTDDAGCPTVLYLACRKGDDAVNIALPFDI